MPRRYIFSSESVGEGHPDKVADTISDAVLDACLTQDTKSRVACETYVKSNIAIVGGEITTTAKHCTMMAISVPKAIGSSGLKQGELLPQAQPAPAAAPVRDDGLLPGIVPPLPAT